jgi:alanyl-tRNA synthetase
MKFLGRVLKGIPAKDLKGLVDDAKKQIGSGVISFIAIDDENKASIVVGVTEDRVASNNAVDLVRAGAEALGGKGGGGRPDMAQAGGPDGAKADAALAAVEAQLRG